MARTLQAAWPLSPEHSLLRGDELTLAAVAPGAILQLDGPLPGADRGLTEAVLPAAGRCVARDGMQILSIGPERFLVLQPTLPKATWQRAFRAVIDMGSAWTQLAVEGPKATSLLRKGTALDLHSRHFPACACAATGFARMRIILWRRDAQPRYDLLVGRSHALSLWEWLVEAAAEFGAGAHNRTGAE